MYEPGRIDPENNLRSHPNWNMRDYIYLRDKGYSSEEIQAIWDRDAEHAKLRRACPKARRCDD